jgi:hypothetical protein
VILQILSWGGRCHCSFKEDSWQSEYGCSMRSL